MRLNILIASLPQRPHQVGKGGKHFSLQLYPLEVLAGHEVLEATVGDEGAVVQLEGGEPLPGLAGAQLPDALVSDELAVRQRQAEQRKELHSERII